MSNDAAMLGALVRSLGGECRICGCSGDSCSLRTGDKCSWMGDTKTLCSNPRCITAAAIRAKRDAAEAKRRRVKRVKGRAA